MDLRDLEPYENELARALLESGYGVGIPYGYGVNNPQEHLAAFAGSSHRSGNIGVLGAGHGVDPHRSGNRDLVGGTFRDHRLDPSVTTTASDAGHGSRTLDELHRIPPRECYPGIGVLDVGLRGYNNQEFRQGDLFGSFMRGSTEGNFSRHLAKTDGFPTNYTQWWDTDDFTVGIKCHHCSFRQPTLRALTDHMPRAHNLEVGDW